MELAESLSSSSSPELEVLPEGLVLVSSVPDLAWHFGAVQVQPKSVKHLVESERAAQVCPVIVPPVHLSAVKVQDINWQRA